MAPSAANLASCRKHRASEFAIVSIDGAACIDALVAMGKRLDLVTHRKGMQIVNIDGHFSLCLYGYDTDGLDYRYFTDALPFLGGLGIYLCVLTPADADC